jgi:two-component system sensor histidine kinase HydH
MKITPKASSLLAAILGWLLLSALAVFSISGLRDRARLIRDNENEQILNMLFTSLRGFDDFGAAIESSGDLRERIRGFAVYGGDLLPLYRWGQTPPVFDEGALGSRPPGNRYGRYTIPDRGSRSVKFILRTERMGPQPQPQRERPHPQDENRRMMSRQNWFQNTLVRSRYFYIDIFHPVYWRVRNFTAVIGPVCVALLLVLVLYIRNLYIRNIEYRKRIEAQKNLVVLGTAAGTLAHEIKNPLLSIRLQTGILEKLYPEKARDEIAIINEEVDRLSDLIYRVNDYMRDGRGNPGAFNLRGLLEETGSRLCGRDIIEAGAPERAMVFADRERMRSVFENLLRNALESGGPPGEIGISVAAGSAGGKAGVTVRIRDRGAGIAPGDLGRIFDPFFTRKSTGTGIGLSISKRFIEAAGGSISITNREGGGAEVLVSLPEWKSPQATSLAACCTCRFLCLFR